MSGRRPDRTRALNFRSTFRECRASAAPGCGPGEDWVTMPQFFVRATLASGDSGLSLIRPPRGFAQKNQGYWTSSAGKIFHDGMDDPPSWTYPSNQTAVSNHSRPRLPDGFHQMALF